MSTLNQIKKQKQFIARQEQSLSLSKLKKRRAETRRKIQLGGLIVKSGLDGFDKATILGGLNHLVKLLEQDEAQQNLFKNHGEQLFMSS